MIYIGRFAPSPTGPLHFGSLVAAVASYCDAKAHHGKWLVRMEDLDKPREAEGAADVILHTLETFGFEWDKADIIYQSQRTACYADALNLLQSKQLIYPCTCTRKEIADSSSAFGVDGHIYPKTCLQQAADSNKKAALRIKVDASTIGFNDTIQGKITQNLQTEVGDFVLKRADGFFAYQLAVVLDDHAQGITHVVRGADLLNSTPRQIYLQQQLNTLTPHYAHIPIVHNQAGEKLSKQTRAKALDTALANQQLWDALTFLGQAPPIEAQQADVSEIWQWAIAHWQIQRIPRQNSTF